MGVILIATVLAPVIDDLDPEDKLQVLVITGQSNSAYRSDSVNLTEVNAEISLPSTGAYYYGTASTPIQYGTMPPYGSPSYDTTFESYGIYSMISNNKWTIGGYEPALAKSISDKTNCDVLIINAGINAASVNYLLPTEDGGEYVAEVISHALDLVKDKYDKIEKIGYCWMQGETDRLTSVADYITDFDTILDWYEDEGFSKCYMVKTRAINGGNACEAQLKLAHDNHNVILASTAPDSFTTDNGLMNSDNLHYTQKGRMIVAEDISSAMHLHYNVTSNMWELLAIIPLMMIVAIVLVAVRSFLFSKND